MSEKTEYHLTPAMLETMTNLQIDLNRLRELAGLQEQALVTFINYCRRELKAPDDWVITRFIDGFTEPKHGP